MRSSFFRSHTVFAASMVVLSVAALLLMVPVVKYQKNQRLDRQKSQDIASISSAISMSSYSLGLPKNLNDPEIMDGIYGDAKKRLNDYRYNKISETKYELCAVFLTDTTDKSSSGGSYDKYSPTYSDYVDTYSHPKGDHCFEYEIDLGQRYTIPSFPHEKEEYPVADDYEARIDLDSIAKHLEVYYADNGFYPSEDQLKSDTWRKSNLKGLDEDAVRSPSGEVFGDAYQYTAQPRNCAGIATTPCKSFVLSYKLSDGSTYSKKSLNE